MIISASRRTDIPAFYSDWFINRLTEGYALIPKITEQFSTYFYYTITAYDKDIEPGVPDIDTSIDTFLALADIVGAGRMSWRYKHSTDRLEAGSQKSFLKCEVQKQD